MDQPEAAADPVPQAPYELITEHIVNPANDRIRVEVLDKPGDGGACHLYRVDVPDGQYRTWLLLFQNGPIAQVGVNGLTHEVLLAILAHRLRGFQAGPFACDENAVALSCMRQALHVLQARTKRRMAQGVEGTHGPDAPASPVEGSTD